HVKNPGVFEVEMGCTFRDIIYGLGQGIRDDKELKFFLPGGASFQWLLGIDEHLDAPYDIDWVQQNLGTTLGSGAIMVFDETTDPVAVAWRLAKFYAHESCGKCTPCREGTGWIEKVLFRIANGLGRPGDLEMLLDVGAGISPNVATAPFTQTTLCPLGPSVVSPLASLDKYFRDEIIARINSDAGVTV
ncbi:MAG TPA: NADH-ubiquinone oxidoreductase-F iron-sulfur binding region domain-containing protein, partial [Acidimicrobiia bacterium]|nr:NADH-ubiquinone oxidoreductase-F iron-sulfur binding region domain-containing protein [Acidimicrobiia bacterium]